MNWLARFRAWRKRRNCAPQRSLLFYYLADLNAPRKRHRVSR